MSEGVLAWYTDGKKEIKGVSFDGDPSAKVLGEMICNGIEYFGFGPYIEEFKCEDIVTQNKFYDTFRPNLTTHVYVIDKFDKKIEIWINEHRDRRYDSVYREHTPWQGEWRFHKVYEFDFAHVARGDWFDFESIDDYLGFMKNGDFGFINKRLDMFTIIQGKKE